MKLGLSGRLTRIFIDAPLTPLLLVAAVLVGALALVSVPREEEPQISVPMVDIMVSANGYRAGDGVELVTRPLEDIVKAINGVEHVYSNTQDDSVIVTARFYVGTDEDAAILRIHEKIRANIAALPKGIPEPVVVGRGISDVAIVTLALEPKAEHAARWTDNGLFQVAEELRHELAKVENVGLSYIVGGSPNQIRIEPDASRLALLGVTLNQLVAKLENANRVFLAGTFRDAGRTLPVLVGETLQGVPDIGLLLVTSRDGRPVYVKDVADIVVGGAELDRRVWRYSADGRGGLTLRPAVVLAFAKRKGANAVVVAEELVRRLGTVRGQIVPDDLTMSVARNYGETANDKANELLFHLALATVSIVGLIVIAVGWREGIVVAVVIPTTILLTLFAAWLMGYTINRVSLFALIFSIGILVDDAIVVVENIVRHWRSDRSGDRSTLAVEAVAEVGNPTIVATLTIVVALLPMMFVSGLMGPYMSPIPANASVAMVFSFFVAVTVTPWLLLRIAGRKSTESGSGHHGDATDVFGRLYLRVARPLLAGRARSKRFLIGIAVATVAVCALFATKDVTVKLLPFDNKSEFQVMVDLPAGSSLEDTERLLRRVGETLAAIPEMTSIEAYAGTAAPFNFNGLVRHSYLRDSPELGELQVNLKPKGQRKRSSHDIAVEARRLIAALPMAPGTAIRVVEVPPGPPVLATLLAEVYGPDEAARIETAQKIREAFAGVDYVVDLFDTMRPGGERLRFVIDQESLEFHGVEEQAVYDTIAGIVGGVKVGYSQKGHGTKPIEIVIRLPKSALAGNATLLSTPVPAGGTARQGRNVELGDVVAIRREQASHPLFRRDGRFAEMVTAELAGRFEAPIYGMLAVQDQLAAIDWGARRAPLLRYHGQPFDESKPTLLWDGEWEVTYVTFRDMGAAFGVAILGIYLLVVAQFGSFRLPLVILVPVPLTLIGIVLGHWALGAAFTATSMIGFIALAGIIVRNSILLVDFIGHRRRAGAPLRRALLEAGAVRFRPIFLTAAAAMIGAAFIITDPIFQGLAISMVFGLASSTALTLLAIPALYVWLRDDGREDEAARIA